MRKKFHLGDILSVITDRMLSPQGIKAIYDLLSFMTGDTVFTHQLSRAAKECRPYLLREMPWLDSLEIRVEVEKLGKMLKSPSGRKEPHALLTGWLARMAQTYGEMHEVGQIPPEAHQVIDPKEEFRSLGFPDDRMVEVHLPPSDDRQN